MRLVIVIVVIVNSLFSEGGVASSLLSWYAFDLLLIQFSNCCFLLFYCTVRQISGHFGYSFHQPQSGLLQASFICRKAMISDRYILNENN